MAETPPQVGLIMGSQSDWPTMTHAAETLDALAVAYESRIVSAHRTPKRLVAYAEGARERGLKVIIAGAGGAAHLPGMTAAMTPLPVFGVPIESRALSGQDSLLSIVQMPGGVPVGTLAIGRSGAINAALLAASVLALADPELAERLDAWRARQSDGVAEVPADITGPARAERARPEPPRATRAMDDPHDPIPPGATIGILGGGQLGRMLALAAARLGYRCHVFEPGDPCPAGDVARHTAAAWDDRGALESFAAAVDVITLEFENVPVEAVDFLSGLRPVRPGGEALRIAQDRAREKTYLNEAGVETAPWAAVEHLEELEAAVARIGRPAVLKTARFGYDGKGQARIAPETNLAEAWAALDGVPCVLEGHVEFVREVAVLAARTPGGEVRCFEPIETRHRDGILHKTLVPAPVDDGVYTRALETARRTVAGLDYIGLMAVEMFVQPDGRVLANEIAPRPHNSGHWTIDACATSQFEQTVRAVCGLPLGAVTRTGDAEMTNLIGEEVEQWPELVAEPGARLHLYGKREVRPGRKMGHVTRVGASGAGG